METWNRSAIVVRPQQPFLDRLHAVDSKQPWNYIVSANAW
jgi:hypothetical protein